MSDSLLRYRTVYRSYGEEMVAWDRMDDFDVDWYAGLGHVVLVQIVKLTPSSYVVISTEYED
jgi:hypothetical protein